MTLVHNFPPLVRTIGPTHVHVHVHTHTHIHICVSHAALLTHYCRHTTNVFGSSYLLLGMYVCVGCIYNCLAANLLDGKYIYLEDLLSLDACHPLSPSQGPVSESPLPAQVWRCYLRCYPDGRFACYLEDSALFMVLGLVSIAPDPCARPIKTCCQLERIKLSLKTTLPTKFILVGCYLSPTFAKLPFPIHTSPLGVIPKKGRPNKWRLIVDLSSTGESINNGIDSSLTSLCYLSVDDAMAIIQDLGVCSLMAKFDLKSAYCLVSVHRIVSM